MMLLFDQNLSFRLCQHLDDVFPQSTQVGLVGLAEADDREVWRFARANGLILVSKDADFAEMVVLRGAPPKVIWLRVGNQPTAAIADRLRAQAAVIAAIASSAQAACLEIY